MRFLQIAFWLSCSIAGAQSITIQVGGQPIGTRGTLNLEPGNGVVEHCIDDAGSSRISCQPSYNSAVISTHDTVHSNENLCISANGSTLYTCKLPYKALTAYQTGMTFVLRTDTSCEHSCSLNIDNVGPVTIKKSDGKNDPTGSLYAGEPQWVFYDGQVFRLMGGGGDEHHHVEEGDRQQDARARRFIASMETVNYGASMTLETTAGDIHKTVTNNAVGNATLRAATAGLAGQHMWVIVVNDQLGAKTITFGQYLRSAGPLVGTPGKAATLQFISDGTAWYEVARSTNL